MFNELILIDIQLVLSIINFIILIRGLSKPSVVLPKDYPVKIMPPYFIMFMGIFSICSLLHILRFVGRWEFLDIFFFSIIMSIVFLFTWLYALSSLLIKAQNFIISRDKKSFQAPSLLHDEVIPK